MSEGVLILEPGDERAKKIGRAMANSSAAAILSVLKDGDLTLSEISERLDQPMTTAKYHVENLLDAELIEVRKIKYSEKGREVKVYGVNERVVIVAPSGADIKGTLLKYASVFAVLLLATFAIVAISPMFEFGGYSASMPVQDGWYPADNGITFSTGSGGGDMAASGSFADTNRSLKAASAGIAGEEFYPGNISYPPAEVFEAEAYDAYQAAGPAYVSAETDTGGVIHLVIMSFFLSGCLILGVMIVYEIVVWRREKKFWDDLKNPKE